MKYDVFLELNLTYYKRNETDNEQDNNNKLFQMFSGILSIICTIPNLISIIIILFKKNVNTLYKIIQIKLCISFIGIEMKYYPIIINDEIYKIYYFFQNSISYSFLILSNYYQFIHSYIAYKLFTSPDDLSKKINKCFIYIFPLMLLIFLNIIVLFYYKLIVYFGFIAYPDYLDKEYELLYRIVEIISVFCRMAFFTLNIIFIVKLLKKIKLMLKKSVNIDKTFPLEKYKIYKKKLILYIISMLFIIHPYLLRYLFAAYYKFKYKNEVFQNYSFSYYFHGIEILSGLIYWLIYIYNKNLVRRILILFCCKKEEDYLNKFIEEKKIYEENVQNIFYGDKAPNRSEYNIASNVASYNTEEYNIDDFKVESLNDDDETL